MEKYFVRSKVTYFDTSDRSKIRLKIGNEYEILGSYEEPGFSTYTINDELGSELPYSITLFYPPYTQELPKYACANRSVMHTLTKNREYKIIDINQYFYKIKDNAGFTINYCKDFFDEIYTKLEDTKIYQDLLKENKICNSEN